MAVRPWVILVVYSSKKNYYKSHLATNNYENLAGLFQYTTVEPIFTGCDY